MSVLSVHLDGAPCAVGCPFCYLGARDLLRKRRLQMAGVVSNDTKPHAVDELIAAVERFDYCELAIAVSEPVDAVAIARLVAAASARGLPTAITTTAEIVLADPSRLAGVARLSLSVDPWKMPGGTDTLVAHVRRVALAAKDYVREVVAIATLSTPAFADELVQGLLARLVDIPELDAVALNALKPPPPFCDRAFWLDTLSRLRPLLDRALDRRLYLDCYVAARLLGIGGCPGRADITPSNRGLAFRSCVYASRPDREGGAAELATLRYTPPAVCPFDTRLA